MQVRTALESKSRGRAVRLLQYEARDFAASEPVTRDLATECDRLGNEMTAPVQVARGRYSTGAANSTTPRSSDIRLALSSRSPSGTFTR